MIAATNDSSQTSGGSTPATFAAIANAVQTASTVPLNFDATPISSGTSLSHQNGNPEITVNEPGIYQASFHSTVSTLPGQSIPAVLTVNLLLNGASLPGASTTHTFNSSQEISNLSFTVPFQVSTTPATLTAVPEQAGFPFSGSSLTVVRLGDVPV